MNLHYGICPSGFNILFDFRHPGIALLISQATLLGLLFSRYLSVLYYGVSFLTNPDYNRLIFLVSSVRAL